MFCICGDGMCIIIPSLSLPARASPFPDSCGINIRSLRLRLGLTPLPYCACAQNTSKRKPWMDGQTGWVAGMRARLRLTLIFFVTFFHLRKDSKVKKNPPPYTPAGSPESDPAAPSATAGLGCKQPKPCGSEKNPPPCFASLNIPPQRRTLRLTPLREPSPCISTSFPQYCGITQPDLH